MARTFFGLLAALLMICSTGCSVTGQSGQPAPDSSARAKSVQMQPSGYGNENSRPAGTAAEAKESRTSGVTAAAPAIDPADIPAFSGEPYITVNDNLPGFSDSDLHAASFETYSNLDDLGRCGAAYACIGKDLMPTGERGSIYEVKPTGWHSVEYDIVDGKSLYNRCHLIAFQLTAENANERNLITGTRYMNAEGMLPFENMVADYIKETGNHVLYRVTPVFEGNNLVADGVQIEGESVEDGGDGILFNVYCYNVQPGIGIDYATGNSWLDKTAAPGPDENRASSKQSSAKTYILNTNTHKFHLPSCPGTSQMSENNRMEFTGTRSEVLAMGYEPCGNCNP